MSDHVREVRGSELASDLAQVLRGIESNEPSDAQIAAFLKRQSEHQKVVRDFSTLIRKPHAVPCNCTDCRELETARAARHHEVLCLVLKEFVSESERLMKPLTPEGRASLVEEARAYADLAYPPPKEQP